jgi:hypothetical protein
MEMKAFCLSFIILSSCLVYPSSRAQLPLPFSEHDIVRREQFQSFTKSQDNAKINYEAFILKNHALWLRMFSAENEVTIPIHVGNLFSREFVLFDGHVYVTLSEDENWTNPIGQFMLELPPDINVPTPLAKAALGLMAYFGSSALGLDLSVSNALSGNYATAAVEALLSACLVKRAINECQKLNPHISAKPQLLSDVNGEPFRILKVHYRKFDYAVEEIELINTTTPAPLRLSAILRQKHCYLELVPNGPTLAP